MTVPLPESGDGTRRRLREERRQSRRELALRIAGVAAAVVVVGGLLWVIVGLVRGDGGGSGSGSDTPTPGSGAPPSLVVLTDAAGDVYGLTILVPSTSTIIHVPPGTMVEVPSLGLASLRDAARDGGVTLLQHSLENELGVTFGSTVTLAPADLAAVVSSVPKLEVSIDDPVEDRATSGRVTVVVPAGTQTLTPESALPFLSVVGDGTALERLVRHQAFWSAYLDALGTGAAPAPLAPVADAVRALEGEDVQHTVLPVESVAGVEGDDELYRVVDDDLAKLVGRLFDVRAKRIRVQVLNGVGQPGIAQQVQPLLVDAGGRVTLSGNADRFDYGTTQIVYYDDASAKDAQAIKKALGVGELVKSLTGLDVVDVTVVVGTDFVTAHPGG